jgi:hypothetical protein
MNKSMVWLLLDIAFQGRDTNRAKGENDIEDAGEDKRAGEEEPRIVAFICIKQL